MTYRKKHLRPKIKKITKRKKFYQSKFFWFFLLLIIIIFPILYYFFISPKFQIKSVSVAGSREVKSDDIREVVFSKINNNIFSKNIFLIRSNKTSDIILSKFPEIKEVSIKRDFPDSIAISIQERKPFAVFCEYGDFENCFLMDELGVVFEKGYGYENNNYFSIRKNFSERVFKGDIAVDPYIVSLIKKVSENLEINFSVKIKEVIILNSMVIFKTSEGWEIHFDANSDVNLQIKKMNTLLVNTILPEERKNLEYIYLQYSNRAYYR